MVHVPIQNESNFTIAPAALDYNVLGFLHDTRFDLDLVGATALLGGNSYGTIMDTWGPTHPLVVTVQGANTKMTVEDFDNNVTLNLASQGHVRYSPLTGGDAGYGYLVRTAQGSEIAVLTKHDAPMPFLAP